MGTRTIGSPKFVGLAETRGYDVSFSYHFRFVAGALTLLPLVAAPAALAQTADLNVTAQVDAACDVFAGSLNFGTYTAAAAKEANGNFSYQCTAGTEITLSLGPGNNPQEGSRAMAAGENRLRYQLYRDPTRQEVWGTDVEGLVLEAPSSSEQGVTVYGLIEAGQDVPAGSYSDVVQITLSIN
jgi:spore coat protein U-like protein